MMLLMVAGYIKHNRDNLDQYTDVYSPSHLDTDVYSPSLIDDNVQRVFDLDWCPSPPAAAIVVAARSPPPAHQSPGNGNAVHPSSLFCELWTSEIAR